MNGLSEPMGWGWSSLIKSGSYRPQELFDRRERARSASTLGDKDSLKPALRITNSCINQNK
ncbi:hypothetical protein HanRHA438_Chr17g0839621 [Helianthus annuus]|nr:hypothetical protein HanRHA438_Chr17g0839621 [Helianthus annuus]